MLYLLILVAGGVLSWLGPWWTIAPVCFVLCWWKARSAGNAFWVSALAGITLWVGYGTYLHLAADVDLAGRVAGIFTGGAPALSWLPGIVLVSLISGLVVGLVSGFSGLAGVKMRAFRQTKKT